MKRGAYLVNNARGAICDTDTVVEALESGQLAGCAVASSYDYMMWWSVDTYLKGSAQGQTHPARPRG